MSFIGDYMTQINKHSGNLGSDFMIFIEIIIKHPFMFSMEHLHFQLILKNNQTSGGSELSFSEKPKQKHV